MLNFPSSYVRFLAQLPKIDASVCIDVFKKTQDKLDNVQVLFIIRVSIEDLKKPLNTKFSIRPKRVSIMVAGCQ